MSNPTLDFAEVVAISNVVNLVSVNCREISAKRNTEIADIPTQVRCTGSSEATGMRDKTAGQIIVLVRFALSVLKFSADPAESVADISATLALRYSVPGESLKSFRPEAVQAFAETNGVYNAWPYWRELLQNTAGRLGIPGIVAPVFRLNAGPKDSTQPEPSMKGEAK
ncbi:MAG TPA: hypothetical protein VGV60_11205 [Candidatus Polarisedimenticolia bacterium]|jgi:hypothetical protein|nr:hypothetical protein [Nitrospirales bacterium]HEV8701827.1 hypothetical protein [Candidatus Polarisedimenticolia bacterium]